ncbi:HAD family hydrolase [candidate division KSB1 bacterium]|nr:HAD family hydrolase [candidate division KSB1 bacterium]
MPHLMPEQKHLERATAEALTPREKKIWETLRQEIKGLTLDLWGTILDDTHPPTDTIVYSEQRQQFLLNELRHAGYHISTEQVRAAYKRAWEYFDELWLQQIAFEANDGLQEMLKYLHAELPHESYRRVLDFFESYKVPPLPLEGVVPAIQNLSEKYALALISDTAWTPGRRLREILAEYEILHCFHALIFSGEVGHTKPHPIMFARARAGLQLPAHECLHTGDIQRTDVAGAKAAGMRAAWIYRPVYAGKAQEDHGPDVTVASVAELAKVLL